MVGLWYCLHMIPFSDPERRPMAELRIDDVIADFDQEGGEAAWLDHCNKLMRLGGNSSWGPKRLLIFGTVFRLGKLGGLSLLHVFIFFSIWYLWGIEHGFGQSHVSGSFCFIIPGTLGLTTARLDCRRASTVFCFLDFTW